MKKTINSKKLKAIKALADRGVAGEKEVAQRMYKEFLKKNKKPRDTKEIKNAKMHLDKKIDEFVKRGWEKSSVKTMLYEKFKVRINQIDNIEIARDMYDHLNWVTALCRGKKYKLGQFRKSELLIKL